MKKIITVLLAIFFLSGCVALQTRPSVCDNLTGPSYLCQAIKEYAPEGAKLEDVGNAVIALNSANIGILKLYSAEEALKVVKEIRAILDNPVSYIFFKTKLDEYMKMFPDMLSIGEQYFQGIAQSSQIMFNDDRRILIDFLDKRIEVLVRWTS